MSTVVRSLTLLLVASTLPALSQADIAELYGQLQLSIDQLDSGAEGDGSSLNTFSKVSRLRLRASDERLPFSWQAGANTDLAASSRIAGSAELGDLRLSVLYQKTEWDDPIRADNPFLADNRAYGGGLRYKLNDKLALKTEYYKLKLDDAKGGIAKLFALGLDYQYASGLQLHASYGSLESDDAYRDRYNLGHTAITSTISTEDQALIGQEKPRGISVGLTFRF